MTLTDALYILAAWLLCALIVGSIWGTLGILSHRNKPSTDNNADSHCAQGAGEEINSNHFGANSSYRERNNG